MYESYVHLIWIDTEYYIDESFLWILAICQLYNMGGANLQYNKYSNVMPAWDSVIYKSKLLCGSINKHSIWTKNYVRV